MLCDHLQLPNADKLDLHRRRSTLADCWDNLASEVLFLGHSVRRHTIRRQQDTQMHAV